MHPEQYYSKQLEEFIRQHCPFLLDFFCHDITYGKGEISILSNEKDLISKYYQSPMPAICTSENGRELASGMYLKKHLIENNQQDSSVYRIAEGDFLPGDSVHIVRIEDDCQHMLTLSITDDTLLTVINRHEELCNFIDFYFNEMLPLISEEKERSGKLILPYTLSDSEEKKYSLIHRESQTLIYFSPQQAKCTLHLFQGLTMKEIGKEVDLSYRTVEYYIKLVRNKLGGISTKKLLTDYILNYDVTDF